MEQEFTDAELRQVAEFVARCFLEVERGLRPREALRRYLSPAAFMQSGAESVSRFPGGGIVRQTDLGRVVYQRAAPKRVHVSIPAREEGDQWGALVMELRADTRGVWRVTELTRVQDRNLTRREGRDPDGERRQPPMIAREDAPARQRKIGNDDVVRAARWAAWDRYDAAVRRLAAVAPEKPAEQLKVGDVARLGVGREQRWVEVRGVRVDEHAHEVVVTQVSGPTVRLPAERPVAVVAGEVYDARRLAKGAIDELQAAADAIVRSERQLVDLGAGSGTSRTLANAVTQNSAEEPDQVDAPLYVRRFLGRPPFDPERRRLWREAVEQIEAYRQRWGITASDSALGPQPVDERQAADRAATIEALRTVADELREVRTARQALRARSR